MPQEYDLGMVCDVIAAEVRKRPRGAQTRLAEALDVPQQTVNKWVKGLNAPEMARWGAIEVALELHPGALRRAAGIADDSESAVGLLVGRLNELERRITLLEQQAGQVLPLRPRRPSAPPPSEPDEEERAAGGTAGSGHGDPGSGGTKPRRRRNRPQPEPEPEGP